MVTEIVENENVVSFVVENQSVQQRGERVA